MDYQKQNQRVPACQSPVRESRQDHASSFGGVVCYLEQQQSSACSHVVSIYLNEAH